MSSLKISCPNPECGQRVLIPLDSAGTAAPCPTCGHMMQLPESSAFPQSAGTAPDLSPKISSTLFLIGAGAFAEVVFKVAPFLLRAVGDASPFRHASLMAAIGAMIGAVVRACGMAALLFMRGVAGKRLVAVAVVSEILFAVMWGMMLPAEASIEQAVAKHDKETTAKALAEISDRTALFQGLGQLGDYLAGIALILVLRRLMQRGLQPTMAGKSSEGLVFPGILAGLALLSTLAYVFRDTLPALLRIPLLVIFLLELLAVSYGRVVWMFLLGRRLWATARSLKMDELTPRV